MGVVHRVENYILRVNNCILVLQDQIKSKESIIISLLEVNVFDYMYTVYPYYEHV